MSNLFDVIDSKKFFSYEFIGDESYISVIREKISNAFLVIYSIALLPVIAAVLFRALDTGWQASQLPSLAIIVVLWIVSLYRNKLGHKIRSYTIIFCLYLGSTSGLVELGLLGLGIPGYIAISLLAAFFLGLRTSIVTAGICLISLALIGYGHSTGLLAVVVDPLKFVSSTGAWTASTVMFLGIVVSLVICLAGLTGALMTLIGRVQEQGSELVASHDRLEELVAERTLDLTMEINARKLSEERFKDFFENEPEYCYMVTTDGKIMDVNRSALDMLGYKKKEIIGKPLLTTIYAPKSRDTAKEYFQEWKEKGVMRNKELIIVKKDGAERTVLLSANAVRDSKGEIIHSISVQRDITERKAAEEKVRKMSQAVEQSPALVVITDTLGNIEFVNPKFCQLTGYTAREVMGKNPRILKSGNQSEDFYRDLWDTITDGKEWRGEFHNKKKNGELYWESASISPIIDEKGEATHYIAIKEDVTERKAMEQELKDHADHLKEEVKKQANELIQSEKMAGIGLLVAGVAHEVNNPLAYVKSNSNFLKEDFLKMKEHLVKTGWEGGDLKETEELLDSNIEGLDRIAKITRTLKRFARPDSGGRAFVNINEGIRDTLIMVNNQLKFRIEVHEDYGKIPMLDCNIGQLNQVFMNLMINASQAMEKGDLWIKTWSDDQNIYIRIEDNGKGIAEDRIMNIFDPFYTTKENGTGLGLSISYRIIQEHDGEINVESDRNKGTIMTIRLPLEA